MHLTCPNLGNKISLLRIRIISDTLSFLYIIGTLIGSPLCSTCGKIRGLPSVLPKKEGSKQSNLALWYCGFLCCGTLEFYQNSVSVAFLDENKAQFFPVLNFLINIWFSYCLFSKREKAFESFLQDSGNFPKTLNNLFK